MTYKTDITAGLNEVNTSIGSVNTLVQSIASEKSSIAQAQAALESYARRRDAGEHRRPSGAGRAGASNVQAIQVNIDKASLVSPMSGVDHDRKTRKREQIASPGVPVVSLIADNSLEVDAYVPEVDIGKISIGRSRRDDPRCFPGETFTGKVFYIDPAETIISGRRRLSGQSFVRRKRSAHEERPHGESRHHDADEKRTS